MGTPGGVLFSPVRESGAENWLTPPGDGVRHESASTADGVVWTVDNGANLDAFDASSSTAHRPDHSDPVLCQSSGRVL